MIGKFNNKLTYYDYIMSFDLALHNTGASVYSVKDGAILDHDEIVAVGDGDLIIYDLYEKIKSYIINFACDGSNILIVKEAMPVQCGKFTTIKTLQQLAKAHASLGLAIEVLRQEYGNVNVVQYDDIGIHSVSVKALFATEECKKPTKKDIRAKVVDLYHLNDGLLTDDISDSIAVIHTLLNRKWNQDIKDEIKNKKKEIKTLKQNYAIENKKKDIEWLESLILKEEKDG